MPCVNSRTPETMAFAAGDFRGKSVSAASETALKNIMQPPTSKTEPTADDMAEYMPGSVPASGFIGF